MRDECHDLVRERVILERRADHWGALRQDLRLTMRGFSANRVFAALVVFTIAIGIGANAAVFSVTYGTLLRPLPFHDAGALVRLWSRNAPRHLDFFSVSAPDYRDWKAQARELSAMAAFERQHDATVMHAGEVEAVQASAVSPDIFPLLGTTPFRGRALVADDAAPGAPAVAVVRYGFWNSRFGADPSLVGSALDLDGTRVTVVGIMPPRFAIPGTPADIWTPITSASTDRGNRYLRAEPVPLPLREARRRWAELLRQFFEVDPLRCPQCGGAMRIVAVITQRAVIDRILDHLRRGRDSARGPPQAPPSPARRARASRKSA